MRSLRKHRKLIRLFIFLLIPVLAYAGIKLALWYSTQQTIDNISKQLAGFVELKYTNISSSLKGSVTIHGWTLFFPMIKETMHIKSVRVSADNVLNLLTLKSKLDSKDIPEHLGLYVEGLKVNLNSELFNAQQNTKQTPTEQLNTLACGNLKRFDHNALKEMGYSEINTDFNLNYRYDSLSQSLQLNYYNNIENFFSTELSAEIKDLKTLPGAAEVTMGMVNPQSLPRLGKVIFTIEDDSFINRKIIYCAKQNKSDKQTYINKHVSMFDQYLQQIGIKLDQALISAYQKTLTHPGNIIFSMDFSDVSNFIELSEYLPNDIITQLNTELLINNKTITPIALQINKQRFQKMAMGETPKEIKLDDPNIKPQRVQKYRLVNKNNLAQYNKFPVIIKTTHGKTFKGKLSVKPKNKFEVTSRSHGGQIGYFVNKNDIKSVQVYY